MKIFYVVLFLFVFQKSYCQKDTIWYDKDWNPTEKMKAEFYRPTPAKTSSGKYLIIDYFKNGKKQMEAISDFPDKEFFNGDVIHYYENGYRMTLTPYVDNLITGTVIKYREEDGGVDFETPMLNNEQHGTQVLYYPNGKIMAKLPFKNGKEHGLFVKFDENGKAEQNLFYIEGEKIKSRTEFYEKFYGNAAHTEKTSFGTLQVINLDEFEESENGSKDEKKQKIADFESFMDQYEEAENNLGVTKMMKLFDADYFKMKSSDFSKVLFNIHSTGDGLYIMDTYTTYHPKDNEIIFLYEMPEKRSLSTQKIYFKIGKQIKKDLKNNQPAQLEIVRFLESRVFGVSEFSGSMAFDVLEKELEK